MKFQDLIILLPCQSLEDFSLDRTAADAEEILSAYSALWHPALLASAQDVPNWVRAEDPPEDPAGHLVMLPSSSQTLLPSEWPQRARSAGACIIDNLKHRDEMVAAALEHSDGGSGGVDPELARDFLALGTSHLLVELLTRQLRYMSNLDEVRFRSETVGAAEAALKGDAESAREQLRTAFEQLTEAREYFYPVEAHLVDLTLVAPTTLGPSLRRELSRGEPTNLLITGATVEKLAAEDPETLAALKEALEKETASVVGGESDDPPLALLPLEAVVEHLQRGLAAYQRHLGSRPKIFGRRRFGLTPVLPQLLTLLGFEGAFHFTLDDGRFPAGNQSKIRWEGVDGTVVEALARLPLDVTGPDNFLRLPEKLGDTLDLDHTATAVMAHWPGQSSPWYDDLRRMAGYSPVLGRFVTVDDYFQQTSMAGQQTRYSADQYRSPYLRQDVAGHRADPISRWVRYYARRVRIDALGALACLADLVAGSPSGDGPEEALRRAASDALVSAAGDDAKLDDRIDGRLKEAFDRFAKGLPRAESMEETGFLLVNPFSFPHRRWVDGGGLGRLPAIEGAVCAAAESDEGKQIAVEVPPMGFARVGPGQGTEKPIGRPPRRRWWQRRPQPEPPMAEEHVLRNEHFEVAINPTTGAMHSLHDYRSRGSRLAQQIALRMPDPAHRDEFAEEGPDTDYSIMAADEVKVIASGPLVGEIGAGGRLLDRRGQRLAGFRQTIRARRGSRVLELEIELDVDRQPEADPWDSYYGVRFAWGDATADVFRSVNQISRPTEASRLEAPHFVDIRGEKTRTTILTGGLPYHRRFGLRKLDTLLVVRGETARRFRLGVGVDLRHPLPAALDFLAPQTMALPLERAAPPAVPSGWLFHLDARNVVATHWEPVAAEARIVGFRVRLLETEGRRAKAVLRCFRPVGSAQRIDFGQQPPSELSVQDDQIKIDVGPHQFTQIEARWV